MKAFNEDQMVLTNTYEYPENHCTVRVHRPNISAEERKTRLEGIVRAAAEILDRAQLRGAVCNG